MSREALEYVQSIATLTGSSLVPGCAPKDTDYFAKYDVDSIGKLSQLGGKYGDLGDFSLNSRDWGRQTKMYFIYNERRVEVFFVEKRYFSVLTLYTRLLHLLCRNEFMRGVLTVKFIRVLLAESIRQAFIGEDHAFDGKLDDFTL